MYDHLRASSDAFWGVLVQAEGWRVIVQARGTYGLQVANGADCWETVEAFPTAAWLFLHLHGVYDVPGAFALACEVLPELPPRGKAERFAVLRLLSERGVA